jgi:hypothetical protein
MKIDAVHIIVRRLREALEAIEKDIEDTPEYRRQESEAMIAELNNLEARR